MLFAADAHRDNGKRFIVSDDSVVKKIVFMTISHHCNPHTLNDAADGWPSVNGKD